MRQTKKVSWLTADTRESIAINSAEHKNAGRFLYLLQPGKAPIHSIGYEGNAMIGGTNIYVWIAEMNFPEQTRNMSENGKIFLGKKAVHNNTPLLFPVKLSYFPKTRYSDVGASTLCPHNGHRYPKEVLEVDGRTCGNCVFAKKKENQCNPRFGIALTCMSHAGSWKPSDYCSHFTPPNIVPDLDRTVEEIRAFENFHRPDFE